VLSQHLKSVPIFTDEVAQAGGWHGQALAKAFAHRGWHPQMVSLDSCHISIENGQVKVHIPDVEALPAIAFVRGVAAGTTQQIITRLNLLHTLKRHGVIVFNDAKAIETTVDKNLTSQILAEQGIATPKTWVCEHRAIAHSLMHEAIASGKKLVIKPLFGSQGKGVRLIATSQDFALPQDRFVDGVYYLQEQIDTGKHNYDYRVFVIGQQVMAVMKRQGNGWLHNVAQGAHCESCDEQDVANLGLQASLALNMHYAGVDIMRDKHGKLWVIEVNSIPAWRGLQSVTEHNIAQHLVDALLSHV
jgi:tetrahydromethanopterin:alpha-L-glutamate ligase